MADATAARAATATADEDILAPSLSSQRDDQQCRHEKPNVAKKQIAARPVAELRG
jgi:hypothetical protein